MFAAQMNDDLLFSVFAFVFGACVGSFLNVCIYRLPLNLSINLRELRGTHRFSLFRGRTANRFFFPHHLEGFSVADRSRLLGFHCTRYRRHLYRLRAFHYSG